MNTALPITGRIKQWLVAVESAAQVSSRVLKAHIKRANELADIHLAWIKTSLKKLATPNLLDMIEIDPLAENA